MSVKDFRTNPLPDNIICALIDATAAYANMDALLTEYPSIKAVLTDMLLSLDIYYDLYKLKLNPADICLGLYILDKESVEDKRISVMRSCIEYAQSKVQITGILTAGDILKIDKSIENSSVEQLTVDEHSDMIGAIWSILHDLYGPQRQYPLLLETAIAYYSFLSLPDAHRLSLRALSILFSVVHQNGLAFRGISMHWTLLTAPRLNIISMGVENALIHILNVFQQMWTYTAALIRKLNDKRKEITQFLELTCPQQASAGFSMLLSESICIRNKDVSSRLRISNKTVIKHLKQLEQEKILFSIKSGREIFYFNNMLFDLLKQTIGVSDNG